MKTRLLIVFVLWSAMAVPLFAQTSARQLPAAAALANRFEPQPLNAFDKQLIDTEKALLDAFYKGDASYVKEAIAEDFFAIGANGDTGNKAELVEWVHSSAHEGPAPIVYDFKVVKLSDNAAVVTYNAVFDVRYERYQHLSATWVKEGGQWKLKFQQTTLNLWSAHDL